jgi:geranylgeranyl pyrophosphate synthase
LAQTRQLAEQYAKTAKALLEEFPPSTYRDAIISIPEFILNRKT